MEEIYMLAEAFGSCRPPALRFWGFGMTIDSSDEGHFDVAIAFARLLPRHQDATGPKFLYLALSEIIFMSRVICKSPAQTSSG